VSLKDIGDLQTRIEKVKNYPALVKELRAQYGVLPPEEYMQKAKSLSDTEQFDSDGKRIRIKYVANHYYIPIILSEAEKIDYIKHIIKTPSEVKFVNDLERYLENDNKFKEFDWWLFSKLDESLDQVYIPYYDPKTNRIRHFYPDFVFWLQKGNHYFIVFIDPKGTSHTEYMHKVDGYRMIFEEDGNGRKVLDHKGLKVRVFTFLYTDDVNVLSQGYRKYWSDNIERTLTGILNASRSGQVT
jgi:type III restriction enzyme